MSFPRHTARGIVVHDGKLLLMERWRGDLHYFSIPGGGVEEGEAPAEAVAREIMEETTVTVAVKKLVIEMRDDPNNHQIYLCSYIDGQPELPKDAPEYLHATPNNRFQPRWVEISELDDISFGYWDPVKPVLLRALENGFPEEVVIVSPGPAR